jgi:hypothetical protein
MNKNEVKPYVCVMKLDVAKHRVCLGRATVNELGADVTTRLYGMPEAQNVTLCLLMSFVSSINDNPKAKKHITALVKLFGTSEIPNVVATLEEDQDWLCAPFEGDIPF